MNSYPPYLPDYCWNRNSPSKVHPAETPAQGHRRPTEPHQRHTCRSTRGPRPSSSSAPCMPVGLNPTTTSQCSRCLTGCCGCRQMPDNLEDRHPLRLHVRFMHRATIQVHRMACRAGQSSLIQQHLDHRRVVRHWSRAGKAVCQTGRAHRAHCPACR